MGSQYICYGIGALCFIVAVVNAFTRLTVDRRRQKKETINVDNWNGDYRGEGTWLKPRD